MPPHLYSPLPVEAYVIPSAPTCEVREICRLPQHWQAVWNMFWMTEPKLDALPGAGATWWRNYQPTEGLLAAITADVLEDEALLRKLMARPWKFAEFWGRYAHTAMATYEILGDAWIETVRQRADEANERYLDQHSGVVARIGNVVQVQFRKVA